MAVKAAGGGWGITRLHKGSARGRRGYPPAGAREGLALTAGGCEAPYFFEKETGPKAAIALEETSRSDGPGRRERAGQALPARDRHRMAETAPGVREGPSGPRRAHPGPFRPGAPESPSPSPANGRKIDHREEQAVNLEIELPDDLAQWLATEPSPEGDGSLSVAEKAVSILWHYREGVEDGRRRSKLYRALGLEKPDDEVPF